MIEYHGAAAASAVIMSHSLRGKKILFVEGTQEGLLLEGIFEGQIKAVSAKGCLGVVEAVNTVNTYNKKNARKGGIDFLGFIDRDYLCLRDEQKLLHRKDIVTTTNRDIEIDILHSKATKRLLEEKANSSKWECERKVVENILSSLCNLSYLRAFNHLFEKKWDFKCIDLGKHTDNDGNINYQKFLSTFKQNNHIDKNEWAEFENWAKEQELSLKSITRGHDATCVLGRMLRKKLGNRTKDETSITVVEENLRLAVEVKFIEMYQWFRSIYEWAYNKALELTAKTSAALTAAG